MHREKLESLTLLRAKVTTLSTWAHRRAGNNLVHTLPIYTVGALESILGMEPRSHSMRGWRLVRYV